MSERQKSGDQAAFGSPSTRQDRGGASAPGPTQARTAPPQAATVFTAPPKPLLKGAFIDCDATESGTYCAPVGIKSTDVWELVRLFVLQGAVAWTVPPSQWRHVARAFGALNVAMHRKRTEANKALIATLLDGEKGLPSPLEIERGFFAGRYEERFQYLRSHRPGGWDPVVRIHGAGHVQTAQRAGRGILFWGSAFAFNDLIAKVAFQRLGLEVYHYTRPVHGLSNTRFGIRYLNSVRTSIEYCYLGARVCAEENIKAAMEVLKQKAEAGGSVSIKVGNRGRRRVSVPFLSKARLELATGPVVLAQRWNAALLPTFTLRAPDGSFDVTIGAALDSDASDPEAYSEDIVRQYASQLEPVFLADPCQWRGWRLMEPHDGGAEKARHQA